MAITEQTDRQDAVFNVPDAVHQTRVMNYVWGALRLMMGWTFLWAFLDKTFGLGFATGRDADTGAIVFGGPTAWIHGGSPTVGVLGFALKGPFKGFYQSVTGYQMGAAGPTVSAWVNWVFMLSMLLIGTALVLGVFTRLAAIGGAIWMVVFYTATAIWPDNNPFLDEHLVFLVVLIGIAYVGAGRYLGSGKAWERVRFVKKHPILT